MHFSTFAITAILCGVSLANYDISMYKSGGCSKSSLGTTCKSLAAGQCCSKTTKKPAPFALYHSANYREVGGSASGDNIKVYQNSGNDACSLPVATSATCADAGEKSVSGASVRVVINPPSIASRRRGAPIVARMAEPDEHFWQNETVRYTLAIRSDKGAEFDNLDSDEAQIEFLKTHGTAEEAY